MSEQITLITVNEKVYSLDGQEYKIGEKIPFNEGYIDVLNTPKTGWQGRCFDENGTYIYRLFLKPDRRHIFQKESGQIATIYQNLEEDRVAKLLNTNDIQSTKIKCTSKEISIVCHRKSKDDRSSERKILTDGKIRLKEKHVRHSLGSDEVTSRLQVTGFSYIIVLTKTNFNKTKNEIEEIFINQPDLSKLEEEIKKIIKDWKTRQSKEEEP